MDVQAFIPVVATGLAGVRPPRDGLDRQWVTALKESWKALATNGFNLGGLIGTLLTVPVAKLLGRRAMFGIYFVVSASRSWPHLASTCVPKPHLIMYFPIGLSVFGVFGSFTYYLPELFPTRLRVPAGLLLQHRPRRRRGRPVPRRAPLCRRRYGA